MEWALLIAIAAALVIATLSAATSRDTLSCNNTSTVRVKPSQTLWEIAQSHPLEDRTTAETVEVIREINGLEDSTLYPDQILVVPASDPALAMASR